MPEVIQTKPIKRRFSVSASPPLKNRLVAETIHSIKEIQLVKLIISLLPVFFLLACGGSGGGSSALITYDCPFEEDGIEGCWASSQCATSESGQLSSRVILELANGKIQRNIALYYRSACTNQPDEINDFSSGDQDYEYDSTVLSSEGIETDLYEFLGYTLISIENNTMCFSEGVYEVSDTHSFSFFSKEEVSTAIDFKNCFRRI